MRSFSHISDRYTVVPLDVVGIVGSIEQSRGREQLYRAQAPQVLERLAARTRFDSITASSAIEDVIVDDDRALQLIRGAPVGPYRDRSESEFAGYRDAIDELLVKEPERLTVPLVLHIHRVLMRHTDDPTAGKTKRTDNFIGTRNRDGTRTVIFETVPAGVPTERQLAELVARYEKALTEARVPPLLLIAALVLDFLAIHPFEEGNGRVARLLTTHELLRHGYGVARYVSLEQRISTPRTTTTSRCARARPAGTRSRTTLRHGPSTCCARSRTPTPISSDKLPRVRSSSGVRNVCRRATTSSRKPRAGSASRR